MDNHEFQIWFYFILIEIFGQNRSHEKLIHHNRESTFSHVGKASSSNQKSAVRMNQSVRKRVHAVCWRLFNLHSQKFVEFPQTYSSFLEKRSNRFIHLDKPIKKYIQEQQSKKTRTKTRWDARLACLGNFPNRRNRQEKFKEGKYAVRLFPRQLVLPSKELSVSSKQTT